MDRDLDELRKAYEGMRCVLARQRKRREAERLRAIASWWLTLSGVLFVLPFYFYFYGYVHSLMSACFGSSLVFTCKYVKKAWEASK